MGHRVFVTDIVAIRRDIELPEICKHCKKPFEVGATVSCWYLRPQLEKVRLTQVKENGETTDQFTTVMAARPLTIPRLPRVFACNNCGSDIAGTDSLMRQYVLEEMDEAAAAKLGGLLYDNNVKDEKIYAKVFNPPWGRGPRACRACEIEADIGTEEVPHPIDPRVHSCGAPRESR